MYRWNLVKWIIETCQLSGTPAIWVAIGGIVLCMVVPYLLGSLNFGIIISKYKYGDDVRTHGSGNAGASNMQRTYGTGAGILTMVLDMLKAVVAVVFGYLVFNTQIYVPGNGIQSALFAMGDKPGAAIAGLFVILGHLYPCFDKFKGGKGVSCAAMVILLINPIVFVILLAIFVIIVAFTKYISLGSVMGMLLYPVILYAFEKDNGSPTACALAVVIGVLIAVKHRENIKRLREGKESRLSFKKKKPPVTGESNAEGTQEPAAEKQMSRSERKAEEKRQHREQREQDKRDEAAGTYSTCSNPKCGHLISNTRKKCPYCGKQNPNYKPDTPSDK